MNILAKTWKDIDFDRMVSNERLLLATKKASEHKSKSVSAQKYLKSEERRDMLREELLDGTYKPLITQDRKIWDIRSNKERTIRRPAFRDQVVHHLLMLELQPHIMKHLIRHNIACIPNRGMEYGRKIVKNWTTHKKDSKYLIQADVKHYYECVDTAILMNFFKRKIRDKRVLALLQLILDTCTNGLVLGYYVCQWFGALYLSELDPAMKEKFRLKCYVRYVDNILIGCKSKKQMKAVTEYLHSYLANVCLKLKTTGKECIRQFKWYNTFVDFIGYRTYREGFQEIRKTTYMRIRKLMNRICKNEYCSLSQARSLLSRRGIVLHSDCHTLLRKIENIIASRRMRRMVSYATKQQIG